MADGFDQPVQVVDAGDGSGRLFVVEQAGRIRIVQDGQVLPEPFLDLSDLVSCCGERGLLSVAFHPDYANSGDLFVDYTDRNGDTVVARYQVSTTDPNRADPASAEMILSVDQPAANHNGGLLLFGPQDGYLYIGLGDGGGGNGQNGQDLSTLLGKILRIDVDRTSARPPLLDPARQPFRRPAGGASRDLGAGVRNPWRFSFDRLTGDLWIGDVGSATYEEVNEQPAASPGGENYGWDVMEGRECRAEGGCDAFVAPVSGFDHDEGCVVTGGYVYHGTEMPELKVSTCSPTTAAAGSGDWSKTQAPPGRGSVPSRPGCGSAPSVRTPPASSTSSTSRGPSTANCAPRLSRSEVAPGVRVPLLVHLKID